MNNSYLKKLPRERLLESLRSEIHDQRVLRAMEKVPRERFIAEYSQDEAYEDKPLPIGLGQTISQPYIVALMTEALELKGTEKVLEVGTGSGYHTAILSELSRKVITVERFESLALCAKQILNQLNFCNVDVHISGQCIGWPEEAPYDAIMVTAAAPCIVTELIDQLAPGGRMVIPVGPRYEQDLLKIIKEQSGYKSIKLCGCRFVPLIGRGAWQE